MTIEKPVDPGVLEPAELLVAEAIQARAWEILCHRGAVDPQREEAQRARLASIVLSVMLDRLKSIGDLSNAAIDRFLANGSIPVNTEGSRALPPAHPCKP